MCSVYFHFIASPIFQMAYFLLPFGVIIVIIVIIAISAQEGRNLHYKSYCIGPLICTR